jgi:hypothetical protein
MPNGDPSDSGDGDNTSTITISGNVFDFSTGDPIEGVRVATTSGISAVTTDEEGMFSLEVSETSSPIELELSKDNYVLPTPKIHIEEEDVSLETPIPACLEEELASSICIVIVADESIPGDWNVRRSDDLQLIVDSNNDGDNTEGVQWVQGRTDQETSTMAVTISELTDDLYKFYVSLNGDDLNQMVKAYIFSSTQTSTAYELTLPEHTVIEPDWDLFWMEDQEIHPVNQIETDGVFMVGDNGPAGGTIIFDKGLRDDSTMYIENMTKDYRSYVLHDSEKSDEAWRYLEIAPKKLGNSGDDSLEPYNDGYYWGYSTFKPNSSLGTSKLIGRGAENTVLMNDYYGSSNDPYAFVSNFCAAYEEGSKNDWFLPSYYELYALYDFVINENGELHGESISSTETFWSSSEVMEGLDTTPSDNEVYALSDRGLSEGNYVVISHKEKSNARKARAMRRF